MKDSLSSDLKYCIWDHPKSFTLKIRFIKHQAAYRASHYLGADLIDAKTVSFTAEDYDDIMRFILFTV